MPIIISTGVTSIWNRRRIHFSAPQLEHARALLSQGGEPDEVLFLTGGLATFLFDGISGIEE